MQTAGQSSVGPCRSRPESVFSCVGSDAREDLLRHGSERHYLSGDILFSQGDEHTLTHFIHGGLVRTYYLSPCGREITMAFWSTGDVIGGPDFLTPMPHIWSAVAAKATTVLAVPVAVLDQLVQSHLDVAYYLNRQLTFKVSWLSGLLQIMATGSVTDCLAHTLLRLGDLYGIRTRAGVMIAETFSHEDLATMIGASRQWTSMSLSRLQRAGVIAVDQRRIILIDVDVLERMASSESDISV